MLIVTDGCHTTATGPPVVSHEHSQVRLFTEADVAGLRMPDGDERSIAAWLARLRERGGG